MSLWVVAIVNMNNRYNLADQQLMTFLNAWSLFDDLFCNANVKKFIYKIPTFVFKMMQFIFN